MVYARAYDQTVADDYFAAMERVEQRLQIIPPEYRKSEEKNKDEVVKVQTRAQVRAWFEQLAQPELCFEERIGIVSQLRTVLSIEQCGEPIVAQ